MADPRALLLEPDAETAAMLRAWLTEAGWAVELRASGVEALRCLGGIRPSLLVSDVLLPGLDGSTVCSHLRLLPYGDRVRVVLLSARPDARDAAVAAGADVFLAKPARRAEFLAAIAAPDAPRADAEPLLSGAVRVPRVAGPGAGGTIGSAREEGTLGAGAFLALLRRVHATCFSGVLEAEGEDGLRAKLFFSGGCPAAARSTEPSTDLGGILLRLGVVSAEHIAASVEEGRRSGLRLGEVLVRSRLAERRAVERALREQILVRAVGIGRIAAGRYVVDPAEPIGLAGFDVHPAAVAWRLGDAGVPLTADDLPCFVHEDAALEAVWASLDPEDAFAAVRARVSGGATAAECVRVGGPRAAALLALLRAWGLLSLRAAPPETRRAVSQGLDATDVARELRVRHRTVLDANHYTVLGLDPDADADEVTAALGAALARLHPDALPPALDAASRGHARAVYERALEAGRVLADPVRRGIYDARLRGETSVAGGHLGVDGPPELLAERARELSRRGAHVGAAALYRRAVEQGGETADLLALLGWARHEACPDDPAAGEPELRRAAALSPYDENVAYHLARLLLARGALVEARRLLRRAIEINHEFQPARQALRELPE